jgi:zinc protease
MTDRIRQAFFVFLAAWMVALVGCASVPKFDADMTMDPGIVHEVLSNGLTVWIRPVSRPAKTVAMHLIIEAGSLNEDEDQRGLAHLVEHIVFEGSRHFPPGTLDLRMKELGLVGGVHNNAATTALDTTYTMSVPTTPKAMKLAFDFLSDVADGAQFPPKSVAQERKVVLAEAVARNDRDTRVYVRKMKALYPDSRLVQRQPIGLTKIVRTAPRKRIMDFYNKWYRPDNAHLVIVGDIDPKELEAEVRKHFGGWQAKGPRPTTPDMGLPTHGPARQVVLTGKDVNASSVALEWLRGHEPYRTVGDQLRWYQMMIGEQALVQRLTDRAFEADPPVLSASMSADDFQRQRWQAQLSARPPHDNWKRTLATLVQELDRVNRDGFSDAEIQDVYDSILADERVSNRSGRNETASYAIDQIETSIDEDSIPTTTKYNQKLFEKLRPWITAKSVTDTFRQFFPSQGFNTTIIVRTQGQAPTAKDVRAVIAHAHGQALPQYAFRPRIHSYLDSLPKPGTVVSRTVDQRLGVTHVTFANGVRLHIKPLPKRKGTVYLSGLLAGGTVEETAKNRGITELAAAALSEPETPTRRGVDLARLLNHDRIAVDFGQHRGAVAVALATDSDHLERGLRYLHLVLSHPELSESTRRNFLDFLGNREQDLDANVGMRLRLAVLRARSSDDPRMEYPTRAEVARYSHKKIQRWMDHLVRTAPLELAITGDLDVDRTIRLAQRYLGSLHRRGPVAGAFAKLRELPPMHGPVFKDLAVDSNSDRAAVYVGWQAPDPTDYVKTRALARAARILDQRLNGVLRVKKGYVYSASVGLQDNYAFPGLSQIYAFAVTRPEYAQDVARIMRKTFQDFAQEGPRPSELSTAKRAARLRLEHSADDVGRWLDLLKDYDYSELPAAAIILKPKNIPPYKKEDLRQAVAEAMQPRTFVQVIVHPRTSGHKGKSGSPNPAS